jgi:hypothetical protein
MTSDHKRTFAKWGMGVSIAGAIAIVGTHGSGYISSVFVLLAILFGVSMPEKPDYRKGQRPR